MKYVIEYGAVLENLDIRKINDFFESSETIKHDNLILVKIDTYDKFNDAAFNIRFGHYGMPEWHVQHEDIDTKDWFDYFLKNNYMFVAFSSINKFLILIARHSLREKRQIEGFDMSIEDIHGEYVTKAKDKESWNLFVELLKEYFERRFRYKPST
jgi:hypothetical protein